MSAIKLLLSHESALEAIRSWDMRAHFEHPKFIRCSVPDDRLAEQDLAKLEIYCRRVDVRKRQIDMLVSSRDNRVRTEDFASHICGMQLPYGNVVELPYGIGCVSPEHVLVQLAPKISRLELQVLMYEFLGLYALSSESSDGMFQRSKPIMTLESLERHLALLGKARGKKMVRQALAGVVECSGSPRETQLALRLALKPAAGGYGIPIKSMNQPISVQRLGNQGLLGIRKPDILIASAEGSAAPFSFVALEYDGAVHLTSEQQTIDAQRNNEILALNGKEYHVNKCIYDDQDTMDDLISKIRCDVGLPRLHLTTKQQEEARRKRVDLKRALDRIARYSEIVPHLDMPDESPQISSSTNFDRYASPNFLEYQPEFLNGYYIGA